MDQRSHITFVESAPGVFEVQAYLKYSRIRIVSCENAEDMEDGFSLTIGSHGNLHMFTMSDEDLGRLSEVIGTFRAGIKETEAH